MTGEWKILPKLRHTDFRTNDSPTAFYRKVSDRHVKSYFSFAV